MTIARIARPIRRVTGAWDRFWFTPTVDSTLTLFRTGLGFVVLCWGLSLALDLRVFFSETGLVPAPLYGRYRIGIFRWLESDFALNALYLALLVSSALVMIGRGFRAAAIVMWLCVYSFQYDNTYLLNAGDSLIRILCAYTALYAALTPGRFSGLPVGAWFAARTAPRFREAPFWLIRLVQIQLTIVYPFSVIDKFRGELWLDGTAVAWALQLVEFERFPMPLPIQELPLLGAALTYGVLAIELALPFLLWTNRTRRAGIAIGIALHLGMNYALRLGFFGWVMPLAYVAFLAPAESAAVIDALRRAWWWLRRRLGITGRPAEGSTG